MLWSIAVLGHLTTKFTRRARLTSCRWQTGVIDSEDDLGTHLSVEGIQNGQAVWLRIVGQKPQAISSDSSASSRVRQR